MKKTTLLLFLTIFISNSLMAQYTHSGDKEKIENLKQTKTMVVLTNNEKFDKKLMQAVEENWTLTEFEFISISEFKKSISNPDLSFMVSVELQATSNSSGTFHYLGVFNGGKSSLEKVSHSSMVTYGVFDYWGEEDRFEKAAYRLSPLVASMQRAIEIIEKKSIKAGGSKMQANLAEIYTKDKHKLKGKTLLINEKYIKNKGTKDAIETYYPYKFEIVSQDKIEEVIENKETGYCFLIKAASYNMSIFIYDAETYNIIYASYCGIARQKLAKKDMKELAKELKK